MPLLMLMKMTNAAFSVVCAHSILLLIFLRLIMLFFIIIFLFLSVLRYAQMSDVVKRFHAIILNNMM